MLARNKSEEMCMEEILQLAMKLKKQLQDSDRLIDHLLQPMHKLKEEMHQELDQAAMEFAHGAESTANKDSLCQMKV